MGTNYYHRTNICACCDRYDETHICKSHVDFEATIECDDDTPAGRIVIGSWQQWKERLQTVEGKVFDEYDNEHTVAEFIAAVERTTLTDRRRQVDVLSRHARWHRDVTAEPAVGKTWLDPEGFTFYGGGFS